MENSRLDSVGRSRADRLAFFAIFSAGVSVSGAFLIAIARIGLSTNLLLLATCVAWLVAITSGPFLVERLLGRRSLLEPAPFGLIAIAIVGLPVTALAVPTIAGILVAAIAIGGLACAIRRLKDAAAKKLVFVGIAAPLAATYVFMAINQQHYAHVFAPEFGLLGLMEPDTYYHTTFSNIIRNFGRLSTGVDGLPTIHYHWGTHILYAGIASIAGENSIPVYMAGQQLVAAPLVYFACFFAGDSIRRTADSCPTHYISLILSVLVLTEFFDWGSYFISESYSYSLVTLLLALPHIIRPVQTTDTKGAILRDGLLGMCLALAISVMKISVGFIFTCVFLYSMLRRYGFHPLNLAAILAAGSTGICGALLVKFLQVPSGSDVADLWIPFTFFTLYGKAAWVTVVLPSALAAYGLVLLASNPMPSRRSILRGRALLHVECLIIISVASLGPVLFVNLESAAYYFANVLHWIALPVLAGAALDRLNGPSTMNRFWLVSLPAVFAGTAFILVNLIGPAFGVLSRNPWTKPTTLLRQNPVAQKAAELVAAVRQQTGHSSGADLAAAASEIRARAARFERLVPPEDAAALANTPGARAAQSIAAAVSQQARTAVFIPPSYSTLWSIIGKICTGSPFFVQAISGQPLLLGIPPDPYRCPIVFDPYQTVVYGMDGVSRPMDEGELCRRARRSDLDAVLILESEDRTRHLACR